ncbi:ribosomal protein L16 [Tilletiopsis washingtonensis]|uniref:Ribosomal protein L16 n=1 Tax=Tilletiopsis washingtonensis TaxID=58919 RepID=A0A316Z4Q5_9BASI|nr:ribosomal protein L16 [Tilletiopsis washingtonensis]PWN96346.1 ribosomal protein L16 [Tilletiopsis washingtonensis]
MASLRSLTGAFRALAMPSGASSSRVALQPARFAPLRPSLAPPHLAMPDAVRCASNLAPRRTKYRKAHKGRVPIPIGGSLKGTTLAEGAYGLRLLAPARLSAKQLTSAETALKRKLKIIKGAQVFMRVFPDIPVCVKGNETRMGKGKGTFEFWACRAPIGRVIFEIGGPVDIRPEVAKEALRLASAKLPVPTEFIDASAGPRLGSLSEVLPPASAAARSGAGIVVPAGAPVPPA